MRLVSIKVTLTQSWADVEEDLENETNEVIISTAKESIEDIINGQILDWLNLEDIDVKIEDAFRCNWCHNVRTMDYLCNHDVLDGQSVCTDCFADSKWAG